MLKELARQTVPSWLWGKLRVLRSRYDVSHYQPRDVTHKYGGLSLKIHLADSLGEGWYDHDWEALTEISLLSTGRLKKGARVFDLGAHQGVVALMLANTVGPKGSVIALEANPHNAAVARRNCELNSARQIEIVQAAVAETLGHLTFNQGLNGQVEDDSGSYGRITVDAFSMDDLAQKYGTPDVLFIDVEGYECHVLRGAKEVLKTKPDCFIEVHVGHGLEKFGGSVADVVSFFSEEHYNLFMANEIHREFVPFAASSLLVSDRFFLVALHSGSAPA